MPMKDFNPRQTAQPAHKPQDERSLPRQEEASNLRRTSLAPGRMNVGDMLALQGLAGNRAVSGLLGQPHAAPVQFKMTVGAAQDAYEQEADHTADQVMRMQDTSLQREAGSEEEDTLSLQREAELEEDETIALQREAMPDEEEEPIQMARAGAANMDSFEVGEGLEGQIQSSKGGGSPLSSDLRAFMEPRFGADFSAVRLHSGSESEQMNQAVSARAFTTGSDIYLGQGAGDLGSSEGIRLLAHELTHTIQQGAVTQKKGED